jgi:hypothetical protein
MNIKKHHGSCLCGDVHFEVELDISKGTQCNCNICTRLGAVGSIVKPAAFKLLSAESKLSSFTRHPTAGVRFFCARCHIYCYGSGHLAELGGDYVSVNLNCIENFDVSKTDLLFWDGRHNNWGAGPRPTRWPVEA